MPEIRVRIAQISDLHINRKTDDDIVKMLKLILADVRPQVLIISGDLANQPVPWQMRKAAKIVRDLQACCQPVRTLVIPGNHDYKFWGNVGLRRLTRIPFEIYFRRDGLSMKWWKRPLLAAGLALNSLYWRGTKMREPLIVDLFADHPEFGLALFAINSNTLTEMMAAGKVDPPDLQQLYQRFSELEKIPASRFLYKIVVVHHHPAPIADAPSDAISRIQDSFMIFYNAGLFVRELSRRGFNLVLHGHKHVAGFLRISCEFRHQGRTVLPIAAAGTATHPHPDDTRGHHLNIIDIFDDDTSRLESRFFSVDTESIDGATSVYELSSIGDIRRRRYDIFRRVQKYTTHEVRKRVSITRDGYTTVEVDCLGNRVYAPDGVRKIPLSLTTSRPSYLRGVALSGNSSRVASLHNELGGPYHFKGEIDLRQSRTASQGPFDFGFQYRLMNGHALTPEEFARHYSGLDQDSEYASVTCDGACDLLTLIVEFPDNYNLDALAFEPRAEYVTAPLKGTDDDRIDFGITREHASETRRIQGNIRAEAGRRVLTCPDPVPGVVYKLRWRFGKTTLIQQPNLAAVRKCARAKKRLLEMAAGAAPDAAARWSRGTAILDALAGALGSVLATMEHLKVSVMVFDETSNRLQNVCANTAADEMSKGEFASGEGCAGFVFEKTRFLLYHQSRDPIGYFIRPGEAEELPGLEQAEVLASFPWIYSPGADQPLLVLGVVNVSSFDPVTDLLALFDLPEEKCKALMKEMHELINIACGALFTI
ncbi:MAG TPA: metallophosphoesterase [Bryobacteraceae bacterium]|nr:metallophosphoesterase [Bryobacteraceae bacterium]